MGCRNARFADFILENNVGHFAFEYGSLSIILQHKENIMGLLEIARGASCRRGYEYYKAKAVATAKQESDTVYSGTVRGSNDAVYDVYIDTAHPRNSHCNCPFADGTTIVCKHQIALYFSFFPAMAKQYYDDVIAYDEQTEKEEEELYEKVQNCILNMKKSEAQNALAQVLFDGPEWQFDKFVQEYVDN